MEKMKKNLKSKKQIMIKMKHLSNTEFLSVDSDCYICIQSCMELNREKIHLTLSQTSPGFYVSTIQVF